METLRAIDTRRSIRKYTGASVATEVLNKMLKAAMQSPSAGDARPWHFVVIDDRQVLGDLEQRMPGTEMLAEATLGILVCGDPSLEEIPGFWPQDCSVATQHILLAAHDIGLGGCWIGLYPVEERTRATAEILGIPEGVIPFALCSIGYPNEDLPEEDRFDSEKVHHGNKW